MNVNTSESTTATVSSDYLDNAAGHAGEPEEIQLSPGEIATVRLPVTNRPE